MVLIDLELHLGPYQTSMIALFCNFKEKYSRNCLKPLIKNYFYFLFENELSKIEVFSKSILANYTKFWKHILQPSVIKNSQNQSLMIWRNGYINFNSLQNEQRIIILKNNTVAVEFKAGFNQHYCRMVLLIK